MIRTRLISNVKREQILYILASILQTMENSNHLYYGMSVYVNDPDHIIWVLNSLQKLHCEHTTDLSNFTALTQTIELSITFLRKEYAKKLFTLQTSQRCAISV